VTYVKYMCNKRYRRFNQIIRYCKKSTNINKQPSSNYHERMDFKVILYSNLILKKINERITDS